MTGQSHRPGTSSFALIVLFALILSLVTVVAGCSDGVAPGSAQAAPSTHVVTDSAGRSVAVPDSPTRIAVMDPFSAEIAIMCGSGSQLVGAPGGVHGEPILEKIYPGLAALAETSGNTINIETLAQEGCDLAIVKTTMSDAELAKLDKMAIPYIKVGYGNMQQQIAALRLVGSVLGASAAAKADALAGYYEKTIESVKRHAAKIPASGRVRVYHSINDMTLTDGAGSLGQDWITMVGCIDVSAGESPVSGTDYIATIEQVYAWNPDYVVCNVADTAHYTPTDARWTGLSAVADKRIYNIPIGATRWGQRGDVETYLAMLWLGSTIYPRYYSDIDFKQTVIDYYRDYLGVTIDEALYDQMLSGKHMWGGNPGSGSGNGSGSGGSGGGNSSGGKP
jgi:iron complex transport system substrate-binding protein